MTILTEFLEELERVVHPELPRPEKVTIPLKSGLELSPTLQKTSKKTVQLEDFDDEPDVKPSGFVLTEDHIKAVAPERRNISTIINQLQITIDSFKMNTPVRVACFLANIAHESGGFQVREENLMYSKSGLLKVFKKYFTEEDAELFAKNPEKIANRVYANRIGNGDSASGDGYNFRGRGYIQLTGRDNYQRFANHLGISIDEAVEYLSTVEGACYSAGWFYTTTWKGNLNLIADEVVQSEISMTSSKTTTSKEFDTICKVINGGTNGLQDRMERFNRLILTF